MRYKEAVGTTWVMLPTVPDHRKQLTHSNKPFFHLVGMGFAIPQRQGRCSFPPWAVLM